AGYELLNRKYRKNHKELEKANARFTRSLETLESLDGFGKAKNFIDNVLNEVCGFKRKADEYFSEEMELVAAYNPLRSAGMAGSVIFENPGSVRETRDEVSRLNPPVLNSHLQPLTPPEQRVFIARFHRLLADHLFCLGHYRSALSLAKSSSAGCLCLTDIYEEAIVISEALLRGDTCPAHQWIQEANYKLKKSEAIRCPRLRIVPTGQGRKKAGSYPYLAGGLKPDDYQATKLGQAMLLLAMRTPEEVELKAAQNELNEQWICKRFHAAFTNFYSFSSLTPFSLAVKAGITAIKTQYALPTLYPSLDIVLLLPSCGFTVLLFFEYVKPISGVAFSACIKVYNHQFSISNLGAFNVWQMHLWLAYVVRIQIARIRTPLTNALVG
ncbi:unnamed protein product, partial [Schistocephalus solidus]|uniref:CCR4-NOT transcription complex subunit 10 n=1 Tax=Schistocephalus solidus TaxID=70667 RepID=A0A183TS96_SCHSO